ncbi:MAG: phenylalanine--tRNA ligase subunit beta [Defluviitaleaceae bacterium]|nr:phenylalanine--tRNA ligase subunit beta [Defluviitaleaceae bacterium]MCL2240522.1 phenylalanine--tRNA ligase subunit beta [Defluviitaleaceae bacterium]
MKIPLSWLQDIVTLPDDARTFSHKATDAGIKVEGIATSGGEITRVVIGQIVSLTRHPDADKLWVTQADVGTEVLQIVTGADNLKVGDYIPVALHGATLANGLKIKKSKMRGQESNGMLCSIGELGCTTEDFPHATDAGILVLTRPHPLGADAKPLLGLTEDVLDFEILSNRPDTNAVMGIAREAAAVYQIPFSLPEITVQEKAAGQASALVSVDIKDPARCPRYIARVVRDVKIAPSPRWMQKRLEAAGLRPVNNIVDITNYVMLEYGQPLHAFDIGAVAEQNGKHGIVVRTAASGEKITTLDGVERVLSDTALLIADGEKPLAIAGVMGGEATKVHDATTTILFESANFNPACIRLTAKKLGMRTDASARYEKGIDPNQALTSVNRAMELVERFECGQVVPGWVDNYPAPRQPRAVAFSTEGINARLGTALPAGEIRAYLQRVGIETREKDTAYEAIVPTFRWDIGEEVDLAEEVARFYGYNRLLSRHSQHIPAHLPFQPGMSPRRRREIALRQAVAGLGYCEALTYPFESPKIADKLLLPQDDFQREPLTLKNPLGEDFSVMRRRTLGGLLTGLGVNFVKRNETARLFEMAWVYESLTREAPRLTLAAYGPGVDYLSMKGDVEDLLSAFVGGKLVFAPLQLPYMHPGRTAGVAVRPHPKRDPAPLGELGELHPQVAAHFGIEARVYVAVLDLDAIHALGVNKKASFTPPPKFPALVRDLAFTVPGDVTAAQCEAAIREKGGQWLSEVTLFDVYQGKQIEAGHKSMAYTLRFSAPDRTLTDDAARKQMTAICNHLSEKLGGLVR